MTSLTSTTWAAEPTPGRGGPAGVGAWVRARTGGLASFALAGAFALFYGLVLRQRHAQFDTYAFDLGLLAQVAWNSLHGQWFDTTVLPFNYLAEHLSPVLLLLAPVFLVWPDAAALLAVQAVAVGGAGVGVYLAARRWTGQAAPALLLQLAYHLAPATGWVARDEFHPGALAIPAVAFATALLWRGQPRRAALVAALALLTTEEAALWVAPFGLLLLAVSRWVYSSRRAAVWGLGLAGLAVLWLIGYMLVLVPAVRPPELGEAVPHPNLGAFSQCGRSLGAIAGCLAADPAATLARATTPGDLAALGSLLGPTAGLALLGPSLLAAVPRWLALLLGNDPPNYRAHYVALLVPAAYLAAGEALGLLRRLAPAAPRLGAAVVAAASLLAYLQGSPLPGGGEHRPPANREPARVAAMREALALVPRDPAVPVAATSSLLPHLALRSRIYLLSEGARPVPEYRVLDRRDPYPLTGDELTRLISFLRHDPAHQVIFEQEDVLVLQRGYEPPDRAMDLTFGGSIRLEGYSIVAEAAAAGLRAKIELRWEAVAPLPINYQYFVHLVDEAGQGFSQQDGSPVDGYLPTTLWRPGTELAEDAEVAAPPLDQWGRYRLEVGWYDLATGERLRLPDGDDHAEIPLLETQG